MPSVPSSNQTTPTRNTGFEILFESLAAASPEQGERSRTESRRKRQQALEQNSDRRDDMLAAMAAPTQSSALRDLQRSAPTPTTEGRKSPVRAAASAAVAATSAFAGELSAARRPAEPAPSQAVGNATAPAAAIAPSTDGADISRSTPATEMGSMNGPPPRSGDTGLPARPPTPVADASPLSNGLPLNYPPAGAFELTARMTQVRPTPGLSNAPSLPSSPAATVASSAPASIAGVESATGPSEAPGRPSPGKPASGASTPDRAENAGESSRDERVVRVLKAQFGRDGGTSVIRLDPPELGYLRVELNLRREGVTLVVDTQTVAAHELLSRDVDALRSQLEAAGLRADRIEVRPPPPNATAEFANDSSRLKQRGDESADGRRKAARVDRSAAIGAAGTAVGESAGALEAAAGQIVNRIAAEPRLNVWA